MRVPDKSGKAVMEIMLDRETFIDVLINGNNAHYTGEFNEKTMELTLTPKAGYTIAADALVVKIYASGKHLACEGTTSFSSGLISYNSTFTGVKAPD